MEDNLNLLLLIKHFNALSDLVDIKSENLERESDSDPEDDEEDVLDPYNKDIGEWLGSEDKDVDDVENVQENVDKDEHHKLENVHQGNLLVPSDLRKELGDDLLMVLVLDS